MPNNHRFDEVATQEAAFNPNPGDVQNSEDVFQGAVFILFTVLAFRRQLGSVAAVSHGLPRGDIPRCRRFGHHETGSDHHGQQSKGGLVLRRDYMNRKSERVSPVTPSNITTMPPRSTRLSAPISVQETCAAVIPWSAR